MVGDLVRGPQPQFRHRPLGHPLQGPLSVWSPNVTNPAPSGSRGAGRPTAALRRLPLAGAAAAVTLLCATLVAAAPTPTVGPTSQPGIAFEAVTSPGAGQPFDVVVADFNGDGKLDLVTTNPPKDTFAVHLGDGTGHFAAPTVRRTGRFPRGVATADFDRDGKLDLAVAGNMAGVVAVHRGMGDGTFAPAQQLTAGVHPFLLIAPDLNGDGAPDIALTLEGEAKVAVFLNDGKGGFGAPTYLNVGASPAAIDAGDVNRDGAIDLAIASWGSNELLVAFGDGRGGFAPPRSLTAEGHGLFAIHLTDIDGDGLLDMLWPDMGQQAMVIGYGDGRGGFPRVVDVPAGAGLRALTSVDLNGDGHLDLAGSNLADGTVSIALADGHGGFQKSQTVPAVGGQPRVIVAADFDHDGKPDLATSNMTSNDVTVLLNRGPTTISLVPTPTPVETPPVFDTQAFLRPNNIALDGKGHLYVSDQMQHRIARIDLATRTVTTVAGTGAPGYNGDGIPATEARINLTGGVALDAEGNLYIADHGNNRVRKVDTKGIITTVAGTGEPGFSGDGGPATDAKLSGPFAVVVDRDGNLIISDFGNARIRKVDHQGIITSIMGNGIPDARGDGGPAKDAGMRAASGLALAPNGDILIAEQYSMRIRRIGTDGIVTTFAGTGAQGSTGDGGKATEATFQYPASVAAAADGTVYISDQDGTRVRRVAPDGTISAFAGTGVQGYDGDGGPAVKARVWFPFGLAPDSDGSVYFSDRYNNLIRKVAADGTISTLVGHPSDVPWGDIAASAPTPPAAATPLSRATPSLVWEDKFFTGSDANAAYAVAVGPDGDFYVAGDIGSGADWVVERRGADNSKRWRYEIVDPGVQIPHAIALGADGQLVVAGEAPGKGSSGKDALVVALSMADGKERWRYDFAESGFQVAHSVAVDSAGNVYVAGESDDQFVVFSLTAAGAPRWTQHDGRGAARGIDVDRQGNLIVVGDDHLRWRVDKRDGTTGARIWRQDVAPAIQQTDGAIANAVRVGADGNATITGVWTPASGRTLRVERRDPNGNVLWAYVDPPGDPNESGRAVALDDKGNAYIAGETESDWLVMAFDPAGRPQWRMLYDGGGKAINKDQAWSVAFLPPHDLMIVGVAHPIPARLPILGEVQWRIARYALP